MARHRRIVLGIWAILLAACMALYPSLLKELTEPNYSVDGSQSSQVEHLLSGPGFHGAGSEQDVIVFFSRNYRVEDPAYRRVVTRVLRAARSSAGVENIVSPYGGGYAPPRVSAGGHAAVARLALGGGARERYNNAGHLQSVIARASDGQVSAWLTGYSALSNDLSQTEFADSARAESIGVPLAFVVLTIAMGALGAAIVPLLLAGSGLLLTFGMFAVLGRFFGFDSFLTTVVTMIGVGIGIDYSLFIVSRFREELARLPLVPRFERRRIGQVVGVAVATSGRTIIYSGAIVALSITSLLVVRAPIFREFVIGTGAAVVCTLTAALTLLPALLAQLGPKINAGALPHRLQPADARPDATAGEGGWARWALVVMRRPMLACVCALALLLVAMAPVATLRSGVAIDLRSLSGTPSGKAEQVLTRYSSAGLTTPLEVVVVSHADDGSHPVAGDGAEAHRARRALSRTFLAARTLVGELRASRQVASVALHMYRRGALIVVALAVPVGSAVSQNMVGFVRTQLAPGVDALYGVSVLTGGSPAQSADASGEATGKFPLVLAITLTMALIFLLVVFRSVVLPLKAVAMNLLAAGATLGLVVFIFQDGHGERLLGFSSPGFIQAYLPLCMFVLLFGLSMDYEIFLIRRMREAWRETGDNRRSVISGVEHTARPISAAAAIMVAVFGSSVTANNIELQQFGFALAAAIAIDATLIRLVLVPALMSLMGSSNWWLPDRLAHILPRLEID
jgi:RND superfamily putative drug exporter